MSQYPPPQQYQQYPPQYPPPAQTSTAAIVSLVASILGIIGILPLIGSIVGVIAGNSAKNDIRSRPGQLTGEGLAQAGVVVGWIGLAMWALALCGFFAFGGVGLCAALLGGNRSSLLPVLPFASVLAAPLLIKLGR